MRRHPKTGNRYNFDGGDHAYRQKVDNKYKQIAEDKKNIRLYAAISAGITIFMLVLNVIVYRFRIGTIFSEITLAAIGQCINVWLVVTAAILSFLAIQGKANPTLLIIATTVCFVAIISFIVLIVFWAIDLTNMQWYQAFFLLGFIINIVPHVLCMITFHSFSRLYSMHSVLIVSFGNFTGFTVTLNVSELHSKLDDQRSR